MNLAAFVDVSLAPPEALALVSWFLWQDATGEAPPRVRAAIEAVAAGLEKWAESPELPLPASPVPEKAKRKRGRPRKPVTESPAAEAEAARIIAEHPATKDEAQRILAEMEGAK